MNNSKSSFTQDVAIKIVYEKNISNLLSLIVNDLGCSFKNYESDSFISKKNGLIFKTYFNQNHVEIRVSYFRPLYAYRFLDILTEDQQTFQLLNTELIRGAITDSRYDGRLEYKLRSDKPLYIAFGKYGSKYSIGIMNNSHFSISDEESDNQQDETNEVKDWLKRN